MRKPKAVAVVALLAVLAVAAVLVFAWPRINTVETGQTPEYPDLKVREYRASQEQAVKAVRESLANLPRWSYVGTGSGPQAVVVQAVHSTRVFGFKDDVAVTLKPLDGTRTQVSIRSHSRVGHWDFGQNARNVRELIADLDRRLPGS